VPGASTLFAGDLFGWGLVPYNGNLRQGQAGLIRQTYGQLIGFGAKTVVPGHGPLCTTAELQRWLGYFDWLCARLKQVYAPGLALQDALELVPAPGDMAGWWRFRAWKHADSVKKVLKAVARGWV
jgi:glyoxylase-like metal-dependent hydrolase (beta-lactamase superfamily II)